MTVPVKPLTDVILISEVPEEPATKLTEDGLAVTVKSAWPKAGVARRAIATTSNSRMRLFFMDTSQ